MMADGMDKEALQETENGMLQQMDEEPTGNNGVMDAVLASHKGGTGAVVVEEESILVRR